MNDYGAAVDLQDPTECPECRAHERLEIDVSRVGINLVYVYVCQKCRHVYSITEKQEE